VLVNAASNLYRTGKAIAPAWWSEHGLETPICNPSLAREVAAPLVYQLQAMLLCSTNHKCTIALSYRTLSGKMVLRLELQLLRQPLSSTLCSGASVQGSDGALAVGGGAGSWWTHAGTGDSQ
jgi:hypothetical protein